MRGRMQYSSPAVGRGGRVDEDVGLTAPECTSLVCTSRVRFSNTVSASQTQDASSWDAAATVVARACDTCSSRKRRGECRRVERLRGKAAHEQRLAQVDRRRALSVRRRLLLLFRPLEKQRQ